ncbi:MAG: hypothetical protein J7J86_10335 [Bacteroidales bacterium]|nr:hypothetical protein [Bacteroidales bacterium]
MDNKYSFIYAPPISILKDSLNLCPEIEKVVAMYYNYNTESPEVKYATMDNDEYFIGELNIENKNILLKILKKNSSSNNTWYSDDELPFYLKTKYSIKPDVFSEYDKRILALSFPDDRNHNYLFYFFFNKNSSNFKLVNSKNILTTENKSIIGYFLHNYIKTTLKNNKNNLKILNILNESSEAAQKSNYQLKKEFEKLKSNLKKCIIDLSEIYIKKFSDKYKKEYILTNEAKDKLSLYTGDINYLESIIEKALIVINNTYFKDSDKSINVHDWHINFDIQDNSDDLQEQTAVNDDIYAKPRKFLDELEAAANELINKNIKLTSENLGKALTIPITNAAISQKIKKYSHLIFNIIEENKDKYTTIRKYFKPISKIIIKFKNENIPSDKNIA